MMTMAGHAATLARVEDQRCVANKCVMNNMYLHGVYSTGMGYDSSSGKFKIADVSKPT